MKIVKPLLIAISFVFVIACSNSNPFSSEIDEQNNYQDGSGTSEHGSGTSEHGSGTSEHG